MAFSSQLLPIHQEPNVYRDCQLGHVKGLLPDPEGRHGTIGGRQGKRNTLHINCLVGSLNYNKSNQVKLLQTRKVRNITGIHKPIFHQRPRSRWVSNMNKKGTNRHEINRHAQCVPKANDIPPAYIGARIRHITI